MIEKYDGKNPDISDILNQRNKEIIHNSGSSSHDSRKSKSNSFFIKSGNSVLPV